MTYYEKYEIYFSPGANQNMRSAPVNNYLIAITTCNQSNYTRLCFESLGKHLPGVIVFDDCSTDDTREVCQEFKVPFVSNSRPQGLTSLWNKAYHYFINSSAQKLILSNNDVLFPKGSLDNLLLELDRHYYVGVLTRKDDSSFPISQFVEDVLTNEKLDANNPENRQLIQEALELRCHKPIPVKRIYGFCFGISRDIAPYAFNETTLLNPGLINTGGELALAQQVPDKMICRKSFVYHFKGVSCGPVPPLSSLHLDSRNDLLQYHKNRVRLSDRIRSYLIYLRRFNTRLKRYIHRKLDTFLMKK